MVEVGGLSLLIRQGGSGRPVLVLHGHPPTSATRHRVAPLLVEQRQTVICADLSGYGRSENQNRPLTTRLTPSGPAPVTFCAA